jgi:restriction system protein
MKTQTSQINVEYSARGIPRYSVQVWHDGLKKHRLIRGESRSVVEFKATLQAEEWQSRWAIVSSRTFGKLQHEQRKALASEQTSEAQEELEGLSGLLAATLNINDAIDWENLKDKTAFSEERPAPPAPRTQPTQHQSPTKPATTDGKYIPSLSIFDRLIPSRKKRMQDAARAQFESDLLAWQEKVEAIQKNYAAATDLHEKSINNALKKHEISVADWTARHDAFMAQQALQHSSIDAARKAYEAGEAEAIIKYCDLVLSSSQYPDYFPKDYDLDYNETGKTLIVDYKLPSPDDLPRLKGVKYVATREEFEDQFITESQAAKLYDDVLYQVVLRTIHELFEADTISALDGVVFNGIVTAVDRTTGKPVTSCVLSLRAGKIEFLDINLAQVDPKACFKSLKGVGSSKLHGLSPVPPIMQLRRDDGRFVSSYEVANTLDDTINLAAMNWEDFEHLIREIFEKEFSTTGGEVKVTQASRDGGVDAIAFDPDPIRGGKIVIQAKRYTNTVGVGAVRDLYGTVLNEGATKGVLVTTSDYGPDSYAFANGKPIVLLSGANLLHMLEKHGHRARIDIHEAKRLAAKS